MVPRQIGRHRPRKLICVHRDWLLERATRDFTLRGLRAELAERGMNVNYRTVCLFVHYEGLSLKKNVLPAEQLQTAIARQRKRCRSY